jgi:glycerophosphoryl diester phosphodiesterase
MQMQQPWSYPRFVAHRGGGKLAPENTLAAMRTARSLGYSMVEFDVKLSSDQVLVLMHDSTLERTTNGTGPAGAHTFDALARLDAGSWLSPAYAGETIPTLSAIAAYTIANSMASNIEIKATPGLEALTGTLVARQASREWSGAPVAPLLSSFSEVSLQAAQDEAPDLPRGLISDTLPENWLELLNRLGCVSLHLRHSAVTPAVIQAVQAAGFRLAVWTVNEPERAQALLQWGADAIITDAIDRISPV